jgi:hypothetical protein
VRAPAGSRLVDPALAHERLARGAYGVKGPRELDEEVRIALDPAAPPADRPRVRGSHLDGTATRDVVAAMERLGLVVDETDDDPDPQPAPYENNAGLLFRGAVPSLTNGGATVIGTGGDVDLTDATDNSGRIALTTGTGPSAAGTICTVTFVRPKPNADYAVLLSARDPDAAPIAVYSNFSDATTTGFPVQTATILPASTTLHWDFLVIEREQL